MAVFWNDALNEEFKEMRLLRKVPVALMAKHFGTTVAAIYAHARIINALVMERQVFTEAEVESLRARVLAGETDKEISFALGRSVGSIRWKIDDLDLVAVRKLARQERAALTPIRVKATRLPKQARVHAPHRPPGRPRGSRPVEPLSEDQIATVKAKVGVLSLRAIAGEMQISVKTMKARAKAGGLEIGISLRRHGADLTREVLEPLIALRLTACQAGKRLNRDRRTVIAAADAFGLRFPTRKEKVAQTRIAKHVRQAATSVDRARHIVPIRAGADLVKANQSKPAAKARPPKVVRPAPQAQRHPARETVPARPVRVVAVRVLEAPPPAREPVAPKPNRRPFGFTFSASNKPKEVLSQAEVDAAVERFIRERGVTQAQDTPEDAAVKAARRLGYSVLRDGAGFTLDGHIKLASVVELDAFVRKREGARLQMTA